MIDNCELEEELEESCSDDFSNISVQVLYRPVLQGPIPDVPPKDINHEGYKWWEEQINRCRFGWIAPNGKYLNGYIYFYMNFVRVKYLDPDSSEWVISNPLYRDNDDEILSIIWANTPRRLPDGSMSNGKNHIEAKPRGIAWTTMTLLGVGLYTFIFRPDNPIGCAYPTPDQINKERLAFQTSWDLLHPMFKRWKGKTMEPINNSEGKFIVGEKIKGQKIIKAHNKVQFDIVASDSAGVYKGDRMRLMVAVEAGLWKGKSLKNYHAENEPSIKLGKRQWGMLLVGGTSNAIINKSTAYSEIFKKPHSINATAHFTAANKVLDGFIDYHTGRSLVEEAYEAVMERRNSKVDDADLYQQEIIENPLTPEEAFTPSLQLAYNAAMINKQIRYIKSNYIDTLWRRGKLEYKKDINNRRTGEIKFVEAGDGDWLINMEGLPNPMYENLHIAGIDDRYKTRSVNKKVSSDASKNAMIVYRQPTLYPIKSDMPVGLYFGNDPDMTKTYEEFYKGMLFWDIKQTLYEYNADSFPNFLRDRKHDIGRLFYIDDEPGLNITPKVKHEQTYLGSQFINDGRLENITCIQILEALGMWGGTDNTDIGSAMHLIFTLLKLTENHVVTLINENKVNQGSFIKLGRSYEDTEAEGPPTNHTGGFIKLGRRVA